MDARHLASPRHIEHQNFQDQIHLADVLVANKADRFFDDKAALLWQQGRIGEHKVFDPFRDDLIRLQKANIRSKRSFMATRIGWNVEISMLDLLTS